MQAARRIKGEQTRSLILETALSHFRERGYDETTMRGIAEQAGVSLGNAYYYFRSKEDLVQEFYTRVQLRQLAACQGILETEKTLKNRISGVLRANLAVMAPYKKLFTSLFQIAADPKSALNPFSKETEAIRNTCIDRYGEVVSGAHERISHDLKPELPYLLWLFNLAVVLFWIYDLSPGEVRTYRLIELSSELIANLVALASLPVLAPVRKGLLRLLDSIKKEVEIS